jgi:hypothetical protein
MIQFAALPILKYIMADYYLDRLGFNHGLSGFLFICFNGDFFNWSLFGSRCRLTSFSFLIWRKKNEHFQPTQITAPQKIT